MRRVAQVPASRKRVTVASTLPMFTNLGPLPLACRLGRFWSFGGQGTRNPLLFICEAKVKKKKKRKYRTITSAERIINFDKALRRPLHLRQVRAQDSRKNPTIHAGMILPCENISQASDMGHVRVKPTLLATSPVAAYLGLERKERSALAKNRERSRSTINDHN